MALPNVFEAAIANQVNNRINALTASSSAAWGKMNVAQMLAHCNVTYELALEDMHPKPNFLMRFILKNFVKQSIVNEVPYKQNGRTAPVFMVAAQQDFDTQKQRLVNYVNKVQALGAQHFEGKENPGFGTLTATEWNNLFYKHLDHHLQQFNV